MVLPTSPPASMSVSQILAEFGITAGTTNRISNDLFPLVGGTAGTQCFLGASFSGKSAKVRYSTIRGDSGDVGNGIVVDSAGNIYVTGSYNSTTTVPINTFGATPTASGFSLPISTGTDAFVIKWNANGTLAGYSTIRGDSGDVGNAIAVDSAGNIYITGNYSSTTTVPINTFGTAPTASGFSLPISTGTDAFVIKWNANGTLAGYSTIAGTGADVGNAIAVDSAGNIYITGSYTSTTTVPINTFGTAPTASGVSMQPSLSVTQDAFVIKWNGSGGTVAGYTVIRNTAIDLGNGIAVDSSQNIYVVGRYVGTTTTTPLLTFGTTNASTGVSMPVTTSNDAFLVKWNANGTLAGYSTLKGTAGDVGSGIAVDSAGNIYITGNYSSTTTVPINTFGTAPTASGFSLPISTGTDAFVIKWTSAGAVSAFTNIKGTGVDQGNAIAVDSGGNIYITGNYSSTTTVPINTFGTAPTASGFSLPISTGTEAFVIKWTSAGAVSAFTTIKGTGVDQGNAIAIDSGSNVYVTGPYFSSTTVPINTFTTTPTVSGFSLPISTGNDAFVIKWNA